MKATGITRDVHTNVEHPVIAEDDWIELSDGCRLFCIVRRPDVSEPVPAILDAEPYGAKIHGGVGEHAMLTYLAARGHATVQVDLRGSADSDGSPQPEYAKQEQDDLLEVIAWMAARPWCTGRIGMRGISWSGFNTLQVAARQPPELCAIMSACSTADRYADSEHFFGGCFFSREHLTWAAQYLGVQSRPPSEAVHGADWVDRWRKRLVEVEAPIASWLQHQRRDAFWEHGSICEDYSAVRVPVLMCAGLRDGFPRSAFRVLDNIPHSWAILGPWGHRYPYEGLPGPSISAEYEIRWWDHWLKHVDNGVEDEPRLIAFIHDPRPIRPVPLDMPGRWLAIPEWPPADPILVPLPRETLRDAPVGDLAEISTPLATGVDAPPWIPSSHLQQDQPDDQRAEDGRSVCLTTAPLEDPIDIVGIPMLDLTISADQPIAKLSVRLCEIWPDGSSHVLAIGALNLTHRKSHAKPEPVIPGEPMRVQVEMMPVSHHIPTGHRLRIALSPNYWPWLWPAPEITTLSLHLRDTTVLALPTAGNSAEPLALPPGENRLAVEVPATWSERRHTTSIDLGSGETMVRDDGFETEWTIIEGDPLSARVEVRSERPPRTNGEDPTPYSILFTTSLSADATEFTYDASMVARYGDEIVGERQFHGRAPRDFQ
jgi:uncharacterized protein